jgi:hypothetical protein
VPLRKRKKFRPVPWRADFKAALALAELTAQEYAAREGVTPAHVRGVLAGSRASARLTDKMRAFVAAHLPSTNGRPA